MKTIMKNTLEDISSRSDEAEDWISNLEDKQKTTNWNSQKKNPKNWRKFKGPLGQYQVYEHSYHGGTSSPEREQGIENLFEEIMMENFPNLAKEINLEDQEAQSAKQDEPKEAHTKTHHN